MPDNFNTFVDAFAGSSVVSVMVQKLHPGCDIIAYDIDPHIMAQWTLYLNKNNYEEMKKLEDKHKKKYAVITNENVIKFRQR
jgi:site-specific DNA-adenine methylase